MGVHMLQQRLEDLDKVRVLVLGMFLKQIEVRIFQDQPVEVLRSLPLILLRIHRTLTLLSAYLILWGHKVKLRNRPRG
jgi:hypothetical protein